MLGLGSSWCCGTNNAGSRDREWWPGALRPCKGRIQLELPPPRRPCWRLDDPRARRCRAVFGCRRICTSRGSGELIEGGSTSALGALPRIRRIVGRWKRPCRVVGWHTSRCESRPLPVVEEHTLGTRRLWDCGHVAPVGRQQKPGAVGPGWTTTLLKGRGRGCFFPSGQPAARRLKGPCAPESATTARECGEARPFPVGPWLGGVFARRRHRADRRPLLRASGTWGPQDGGKHPGRRLKDCPAA